MQLLAAEGYATLLPNLARQRRPRPGVRGARTSATWAAATSRTSSPESTRWCATGSSTTRAWRSPAGATAASWPRWAVTQTDRFAASIPIAVVTDWVSFHYTTNIGQFDALFLQADPYDPQGDYTQRSPVFHAHKCKTPTLILHGEDDLCTPLPQAVEFYNALVEAGCETELVVYPREGHGWTEREHQIDSWNRMRDWLARYV